METKVLSEDLVQKIKDHLNKQGPPSFYWDHNSELSDDQIEKIIDSPEGIFEVENELQEMNWSYCFDLEVEHLKETLSFFEKELLEEFGVEEIDLSELAGELREEFLDYLSVDVNIKELMRSDVNLRITLFSNYDCMNSNWYETSGGGYSYSGYFKQIVDFLHLNPLKVKEAFEKKGILTNGHFPNKRKRNNKEYVDYKEFAVEFENNSCASNLVFVANLCLRKISKNGLPEKFIIPKGNSCGLFSYFQGGGSPMDMVLKRDLVINTEKHFETKYDHISLTVDKSSDSYSINSAYGVSSSFWGNSIKPIYKEDTATTPGGS